jgi:hypothetical protein
VVERWYVALAAAVAIPARTAAGQQAKLRVVRVALAEAMDGEAFYGNREEYATLTVLGELLGSDLVLPAVAPAPSAA